MIDRVAINRYRFDYLFQTFASFVLLRPRSRYLSVLSTYDFRLAAFLKSLRRLYYVSFQIFGFGFNCLFVFFLLVLLALLCSRTRCAVISLA